MRSLAIMAAVAGVFAVGAAASAQSFGIGLSSAQEVPPNASTASGTGFATLNAATNEITIHVDFSGLTTAQTAAHIHQAPPGTNGPVIIPFANGSPIDGTFLLTDAQETDLLAGNLYVNVHTTMFPGGEIRGQIVPLASVPFTLNGAQETPPNASPATGTGTAIFNPFTSQLQLHYEFSGLTSAQTAAHIHQAPPGVAGGIIIPLPNGSPVDGTFTLTAAQATALTAGNLYVNVHTVNFGGGEIRGQIDPRIVYNIAMDGNQEVPPVPTSGTGTGTGTYNQFNRQLVLHVTFGGLTSAQTAAHIHEGARGVSGPIIIPLPNGSPIDTTSNLTVAQSQRLQAGRYYVNVHTVNFGGGEIRGQIDNPPPPTGACCVSGPCQQLTSPACAAAGGTYQGDNTSCTAPGICTPACPCDWTHDGSLNSQDFFSFLTDFFNLSGDYNHDGSTNSQDFFDFLGCFFSLPAGC